MLHSLVLKHHVFVVFDIAHVNPIPFLLTVRVPRHAVIADVRVKETSINVGGIAIGVGELMMDSMRANPIMDAELKLHKIIFDSFRINHFQLPRPKQFDSR